MGWPAPSAAHAGRQCHNHTTKGGAAKTVQMNGLRTDSRPASAGSQSARRPTRPCGRCRRLRRNEVTRRVRVQRRSAGRRRNSRMVSIALDDRGGRGPASGSGLPQDGKRRPQILQRLRWSTADGPGSLAVDRRLFRHEPALSRRAQASSPLPADGRLHQGRVSHDEGYSQANGRVGSLRRSRSPEASNSNRFGARIFFARQDHCRQDRGDAKCGATVSRDRVGCQFPRREGWFSGASRAILGTRRARSVMHLGESEACGHGFGHPGGLYLMPAGNHAQTNQTTDRRGQSGRHRGN